MIRFTDIDGIEGFLFDRLSASRRLRRRRHRESFGRYMTAATARVSSACVDYIDDKIERLTQHTTSTIYYPGQMMCLVASSTDQQGTVDHATDSAGLKFDGICEETDRVQVFSTDTQGRPIRIRRPARFAMAIAAANAGDEGKKLYVVDNQTVGYTSVNAVFVGWVDQVLSSTSVLVRPLWVGSDPLTGSASLVLNNFKNMLDGGDFNTNPWQRGTSITGIANSATYGPDRWFAIGGGSSDSITLSQVADTAIAGFTNDLKVQRASSNAHLDAISFGQVLETERSVPAQGQQVTLSFYAKTGVNYSGGALTVALNHSTTAGNDTAAHLAAASTNWQATPTIINTAQTLTGTMARYSFTGTVPATAVQLGLLFTWTPTGTAGTDDSISINGVQLEIGPAESAFEHRPPQVELALCQRFFVQINEPASPVVLAIGDTPTTSSNRFVIDLPVEMLSTPTITVSVGSFKVNITGTATAPTSFAAGTGTVNTAVVSNATTAQTAGNAAALQGGGGSGYIRASCEL